MFISGLAASHHVLEKATPTTHWLLNTELNHLGDALYGVSTRHGRIDIEGAHVTQKRKD